MSSYFGKDIKIVSAECGTGKTRSACSYIRQCRAQGNHLYIAPTKRLLRQTHKMLADFGVPAEIIDGDSHANVNAALTNAFKAAPGEGAVLLVTWNAFSHLTYFHESEYWTRIIDEVPQLDTFHAFTLPFNHRFSTEHIEIRRSVNEHISDVRAKDRWVLRYFLQKPKDDVHEHFRALLEDLLLPGKAVYVDSESWTRITEQQLVSRDERQNRVFFLTMLNQGLFEDTILLGANIQSSMVYDWLRRYHRCRFVEEPEIAENLRSLPESIADRLEINHFGFEKLFSKYQGHKACEDGNLR